MYRKHMTEKECEKMKQEQLRMLHRGLYVGEFFPQVEKIVIRYIREYHSFAGDAPSEEKSWTITPQSELFFVIGCLNRECTSIGFNLQSVISSAIRAQKTEISGEMKCDGQEAPDHPEQSCDGSLKYTIKIQYK